MPLLVGAAFMVFSSVHGHRRRGRLDITSRAILGSRKNSQDRSGPHPYIELGPTLSFILFSSPARRAWTGAQEGG